MRNIDLTSAYKDIYAEGYKEMDVKRQENQAKGKSRDDDGPDQAKKIRTATTAHTDPKVGGMARAAVKDQEERNKKHGENKRNLEKTFKKPSKGHPKIEEQYVDEAAPAVAAVAKPLLAGLGKKAAGAAATTAASNMADRATKKKEVAEHLLNGGYALNEESADLMATHISDEYFSAIYQDKTSSKS